MKLTFLKVTFLSAAVTFAGVNLNAQGAKEAGHPNMQMVDPATGARATNRPVGAQTPAHATDPSNKLAEPLQYLMKFMGRWTANATLVRNGKSHTVKYSIIGRGAGDGKAMYIDEMFRDSVLGDMKASNLVGYNEEDSKVYWYSVDGGGVPHDHVGAWRTADTLTIKHSGVRKGKSYSEKIDFIFKGRDEVSITFVSTLDSKEAEKLTGVFTREKQAQRPPADKSAPTPPADKK